MSDDRDFDGNTIAGSLRRLPHELPPPPRVRRRTIGSLRRRGLLIAPRRTGAWVAAAAALTIAAFGLGWFAGSRPDAPSRVSTRYMLLLYQGGDAASGDEQALVEEYRRWASGVRDRGRPISGARLADAPAVRLGPAAAGTSEPLQGYFVIEAASDEEALAVANSHPHLRHGGVIVVRRIQPT